MRENTEIEKKTEREKKERKKERERVGGYSDMWECTTDGFTTLHATRKCDLKHPSIRSV